MSKRTIKLCKIDDCAGLVHARGMCSMHYKRFMKHGDPHHVRKPNVCKVYDCDKSCFGQGYCQTHHYRWRKHGDPLKLVQFHNPEDALESRTEWQGDCLVWTGYRDKRGYGRLAVNGKLMLAHRFAWEGVNGPIPAGKWLDHICWNTSCVNTSHLRIASSAENGSYLSGAYESNKSSGIRNVYPYKDKWIVKVTKIGVERYYGIHDTLDAAASIAEQARRDLFGDFAGRG